MIERRTDAARPFTAGAIVNDVHSQLNRTRVREVVAPESLADVQAIVRAAKESGVGVSVAGARHAMGGQQFGTDTLLVDMSRMNRVLAFDPDCRIVEVEAGIRWTKLIAWLDTAQHEQAHQVSIIQKQTGADDLSLGGSLSANVHGRGLHLKPIVDDVESFDIVDANGDVQICSRTGNDELFRLAIGGYGLFGIITGVRLRLTTRRKLRRVVEITNLRDIAADFEARMASGFLYGDLQFMTDTAHAGFMHTGVLSAYEPVADDTPETDRQHELTPDDWSNLLLLAHTDRAAAFKLYSQHYLASHNQIYRSDTHQLGIYLDDYHAEIDRRTGATCKGSEMITEAYVPRRRLETFMLLCREDFRRHDVDLIYGTIRLVERDDESFLAWAKQSYACVIFNLHVEHSDDGLAKAQADFRRIIDRAVSADGSFYLTYHRWATREQVLACYPQFVEFLRLKRRHDPAELLRSDWYTHFSLMFSEDL